MLVVNIVNTYGNTQVNAVVDITTDIEVVLTDITLVGTIEAETIGIVIAPRLINIVPVQVRTKQVI